MTNKIQLDETRVAELWAEYKSNPTPALRAVLANEYAFVVKRIVAGFVHKKPNVLDYEDLVQAGNIGLLDAIEKFNPAMGNKFQTYATIRVRGAVLDEINSMDWTPRKVRESIKSVLRSIESHYETEQSVPSVSDIAKKTEMAHQETREVFSQMERTFMVQMEPEVMEGVSPVSDAQFSDMSSSVSIVMDTVLNSEEREYIRLRFFMGYTNKEILSIMQITGVTLKVLKETSIAKLSEALEGYENFQS